jgi:peptidoglycan/LPS O-acetylase OafA/YrhL
MLNTKKNIYFENLDGIRALAFSMVFLCHFFAYVTLRPRTPAEKEIVDFMFNWHVGVNLFFVLSGFLITYLLLAEKEQNGNIHIRNFYIRRVLRIWPLYFLMLLVSFFIYPLVVHKFSMEVTREHLPWYMFFISNFDRVFTGFAGTGHDEPGVLWSIAVEEQFYLFWPVILAFMNKKYYVPLFLSVIMVSLVYRYMNLESSAKLYFHTLGVMSDLAVGALLAYLSFYRTTFFYKIETCKRSVILIMYLLLIAAVSFLHKWSLLNPFTIVTERLILSVFFLFMIAEQCFAKNSFFKLKNFPVLGKLGVISYGLYCLHMYSIVIIQKFNVLMGYKHIPHILFGIEFIVAYCMTLLLAYFCYRYFEKKFLNLKGRFNTVLTRE